MKKINSKKLIEAVKSIPQVATKERWVITLDRDEGALFYSPNVIPENTELFHLTDEYSLYLDKNYQPHGVMLEYYYNNFEKHHPEFSVITKSLFKHDRKKLIQVINPHNKKVDSADVFKELLEKTLILEVMDQQIAL